MATTRKPAPRRRKPVTLVGRCGCEAVTFRVRGKPEGGVVWCHCSKCQRFHGGPGAYVSVPRAAVTFTRRLGLTWWDASPTVQRGFCNRCGSSLFFNDKHQALLSIAAGSLSPPTGLKSALHIFVGNKPGWYQIKDGLPRRKAQ